MSPSTYLGTFQGERLSRCRGYDDAYSLTKAALALAAVAATIIAATMLMGAL